MHYPTAYRCALLAQAAYQDLKEGDTYAVLPDAPTTFVSNPETDTQLAIITTEEAGEAIGYIVFRGSKGDADWRTNLRVRQQMFNLSEHLSASDGAEATAAVKAAEAQYQQEVKALTEEVVDNQTLTYPDEYMPASSPVKMHSGFISAYLSVRPQIHQITQSKGITRWRVTGHSLGGALAHLCGLDLQYNFGYAIQVYTFGTPKVGNAAFVESYNRRIPESWRIVYGWDLVAKLPRWWQGRYRHVNQHVSLKRGFSLRVVSGSIKDHQIVNYVSALSEAAVP